MLFSTWRKSRTLVQVVETGKNKSVFSVLCQCGAVGPDCSVVEKTYYTREWEANKRVAYYRD